VSASLGYIAVVDDEASVRTMLGRMLRLADYEVGSFGCGEDFLASLAGRIPACAILDIHMPGLSGLETHSQLRATHAGVPAVFITASDDPALTEAVRKAQGIALLRKPFSSDELLGAIAAALVK
jgi:FixJ family two-component response regulator